MAPLQPQSSPVGGGNQRTVQEVEACQQQCRRQCNGVEIEQGDRLECRQQEIGQDDAEGRPVAVESAASQSVEGQAAQGDRGRLKPEQETRVIGDEAKHRREEEQDWLHMHREAGRPKFGRRGQAQSLSTRDVPQRLRIVAQVEGATCLVSVVGPDG